VSATRGKAKAFRRGRSRFGGSGRVGFCKILAGLREDRCTGSAVLHRAVTSFAVIPPRRSRPQLGLLPFNSRKRLPGADRCCRVVLLLRLVAQTKNAGRPRRVETPPAMAIMASAMWRNAGAGPDRHAAGVAAPADVAQAPVPASDENCGNEASSPRRNASPISAIGNYELVERKIECSPETLRILGRSPLLGAPSYFSPAHDDVARRAFTRASHDPHHLARTASPAKSQRRFTPELAKPRSCISPHDHVEAPAAL